MQISNYQHELSQLEMYNKKVNRSVTIFSDSPFIYKRHLLFFTAQQVAIYSLLILTFCQVPSNDAIFHNNFYFSRWKKI